MEMLKKINVKPQAISLKEKTTFAIGGQCAHFYEPSDSNDLVAIWKAVCQYKLPYFILGAGSNVLFNDKPIERVIICLDKYQKIKLSSHLLEAQAGARTNQMCELALKEGLSGFEFMYGLPASIGGALYMNARCFGQEIWENLVSVTFLNEQAQREVYLPKKRDFSYKNSPFQHKQCLILSAQFSLRQAPVEKIKKHMQENWLTRKKKGHFLAPCAGSYFKNNYQLGLPSGQLIEEAGLKGHSIGGAQIAPWHANFLINVSGATCQDVLKLAQLAKKSVKEQRGITLEEEVIFVD